MRTFYVMLYVDNWVTIAKVNAENLADAMQFAEENYCKKRYEGTSVPCHPAGAFTEEMYNVRYPYALVVVKDRNGNIVEELLSPLDEFDYECHFKEVMDEIKREYTGYHVSGRIVHLSEVEYRIIDFYRYERGFNLEKAIMTAQRDAQNVADLMIGAQE